jgi:dihydroorotate dehydrogenase
MYSLLLRLLFLLPPEKAHHVTMSLLRFALAMPVLQTFLRKRWKMLGKPVTVAGVTFPNAVGLAAGFDKDARYLDELEALGFGHVEVGTVTPRPQAGNPKPRLFRLVQDKALINRMGFNNEGMEAMAARLEKRKPGQMRLGINIGKNKDTPNEAATDDYLRCFRRLYAFADYMVVNVSSPNTPGLRALQDKEPLTRLLQTLLNERAQFVQQGLPNKPLLLKIAPDLSDTQLDEIAELCLETGIDGLVVNNTTLSRAGLQTPESEVTVIGAGGLSGAPLTRRADEVLQYLRNRLPASFPIIGVGGIMTADDAAERHKAGAQLVQLYTGFVYGGPDLVRAISRRLAAS